MKKTYIYVLSSKQYEQANVTTYKIGSSNNPMNRRNALQTCIPHKLNFERIYEIKNYSAYDVDEFLKTINNHKHRIKDLSIRNYRPEEGGGTEHYILPRYDDLEKLFLIIGVEYTKINDYSIFDGVDDHVDMKVNKDVLNEFDEKITKTNGIVLREYQRECVNEFKRLFDTEEYFQGIYYLATGLGKTLIAINICLEHLRKYPTENILWITFRNDIINGQREIFNMYKIFDVCSHGKFKNYPLDGMKGRVIVVLRQSLINKKMPERIFNGIIYDECHDASKTSTMDMEHVYDGKTYEILKNMTKTQNLRYRIGFSATPLTDDPRQNRGIVELYGDENKINYLQKYSLIRGVADGWLSKPNISIRILDKSIYDYMGFVNCFLSDEYKNGKTKERIKIRSKYLCIVEKIITDTQLILTEKKIKKGIMWFPNVEMVKYMYGMMSRYISDIDVYYSTAQDDECDDEFRERDNNCIMIACDKFKTGFDGKNIEFGINLQTSDPGHIIIQKMGRLMRKKETQPNAYFYQYCCTKDDYMDKVVNTMAKVCNSFELCENNFSKIVGMRARCDKTVNPDHKIIFDVDMEVINMDEIEAKVIIEMNGGMDEKNIKKLLHYKNKKAISGKKINVDMLICTKKDVNRYLDESRIDRSMINYKGNFVKYCVGKEIFDMLTERYCYNIEKFTATCKELKIDTIEKYKLLCDEKNKLPPFKLLANGFYYNMSKQFNIYNAMDMDTIIYTF